MKGCKGHMKGCKGHIALQKRARETTADYYLLPSPQSARYPQHYSSEQHVVFIHRLTLPEIDKVKGLEVPRGWLSVPVWVTQLTF